MLNDFKNSLDMRRKCLKYGSTIDKVQRCLTRLAFFAIGAGVVFLVLYFMFVKR